MHFVCTKMNVIAIFLVIITLANATRVKNCTKSAALAPSDEDIKISSCQKNKCILKRNTEASIEIRIKPTRDFQELNSDIQGIILGVDLPFPGYYGASACPNIYDAEGKNHVGCPLKAGETYIYKNSFKVLPIYPTVTLEIHWGLGDKKGDAVCFEVPARIKA